MEKHSKPNVGIEILLKTPDSFLIVKESLSRIGIASKTTKTLYQSCHILHRSGRYFIVHFLELFLLDGKEANISEDDYRRRNTITKLLNDWKLCEVVNKAELEFLVHTSEIKIVPFKEKKEWSLIAKYTIGQRKKI